MKGIYLAILLLLLSFGVQAQDYFLKNFSTPINVSNSSAIAALPDDGIVHVTHLQSNELVIRRINKCGEQVWAKEIKHPSLPMDVVDTKTDANGNFIFAGNLGQLNNGSKPFIMSIAFDGTVNYFKTINLPPNIQSITYSFITNKLGEFYLYFNYNTGGSSTPAISVAKLDAAGTLIWFKSYTGLGDWGRAFTTEDGGLLFRSGATLTKTNADGTIAWSNNYQQLGNINYPIEVEGGYILFKYRSGIVNNTENVIKLNKEGEVLWVTNDFPNFIPNRGILRKNGNVLFTGNSQGVGLVELDTSSGAIVRFKRYDPSNTNALIGTDLYEDESGNVLVSGIDNSGFVNANLYLRVDSLLNLQSCQTQNLQISTVKTPNVIRSPNNTGLINRSNNLLSINNETFVETAITAGTFIPQCIFQEDRGDYQLGNDTILCPKQVLTLGDLNSTFDDYLWSTGEKSKQITVNTAGIYTLQVVAACDTLRDTINVSYYPNVDLFLGEDTSICTGDSLQLSANLTLSNYLWSTGETGSSIQVKQAGIYWLETQAVCGAVRDSIEIFMYAQSSILELGNDTTICPGSSITLGDASSDFSNFLWQSGETTQFITVSSPGTYVVEASTFCDTLTDGITVGIAPSVSPILQISNTVVQTTESVTLINLSGAGTTAVWDFGDGTLLNGDTVTHLYSIPGSYTLTLTITTIDGCQFSTSQLITVNPSDYFVPTVFSPNGDGINDEFIPVGKDIVRFETTIYNRWGEAIYSEENIPWNGRSKQGRTAKNGTYYYIMKIYWSYGGSKDVQGEVSVLK